MISSSPTSVLWGLPPCDNFSSGFCRASNNILKNNLRSPLRMGPLFWPWEKVKVGRLSVSPMGFGTWAWGNQLLWGYKEEMDASLQEIFNLAVLNGITLFDTADSYGTGRFSGRSEMLLGKFIREYKGADKVRESIVVATKFAAYPWRLTSSQFLRACKSSLSRMQLEQIGIGQLHWSTANYAPLQEQALWGGLVAMYEQWSCRNNANALCEADAGSATTLSCSYGNLLLEQITGAKPIPFFLKVSQVLVNTYIGGLVYEVGVSNYGPNQLLKIHDYLKSRGVPLSSAQVQFSLLSMGDDQMELKAMCDSLGIKLISYSPLGLGMLTGKYSASKLPDGPRSLLFRRILPGLDPLLGALREVANRRDKTMSQVAINWCICKGTIPIPGVKSVRQVEENLGSLGWRLSSDEIFVLESAAKKCSRKMIQNIFQTR